MIETPNPGNETQEQAESWLIERWKMDFGIVTPCAYREDEGIAVRNRNGDTAILRKEDGFKIPREISERRSDELIKKFAEDVRGSWDIAKEEQDCTDRELVEQNDDFMLYHRCNWSLLEPEDKTEIRIEDARQLAIKLLRRTIDQSKGDWVRTLYGEDLAELEAQEREGLALGRDQEKIDFSEHTFFLEETSPFSQWYPAEFWLDGRRFTSVEQYMMWRKATLFNDLETAQRIMETISPEEAKRLGRQVKNFSEEEWKRIRKSIVFRGNYAKFSQNPDFLEQLLATAGTLIVEANPEDDIWGIGMSETQARQVSPEQWRGQNLLGKILTVLREHFLQEQAQT